MGEHGRGRRAVNLACPNDFRISEKELLNDYSIGTTKSGKPRISKINDDNLYLMISSQWGYTRRGCGHIETNGEVLSKGAVKQSLQKTKIFKICLLFLDYVL